MSNGKMNEKSWSLKGGREQTANQNKKNKKDRPHYLMSNREKWNKKKGISEKTKKGSKDIISIRCD